MKKVMFTIENIEKLFLIYYRLKLNIYKKIKFNQIHMETPSLKKNYIFMIPFLFPFHTSNPIYTVTFILHNNKMKAITRNNFNPYFKLILFITII